MLARATSIRSVSESMPVRFLALVTSASGILPRTTWVLPPRSRPSFSAMTITSRSLAEPLTPASFLLREEPAWTLRFMFSSPARKHGKHRVAQYQCDCSTPALAVAPAAIWPSSVHAGQLARTPPYEAFREGRLQAGTHEVVLFGGLLVLPRHFTQAHRLQRDFQ